MRSFSHITDPKAGRPTPVNRPVSLFNKFEATPDIVGRSICPQLQDATMPNPLIKSRLSVSWGNHLSQRVSTLAVTPSGRVRLLLIPPQPWATTFFLTKFTIDMFDNFHSIVSIVRTTDRTCTQHVPNRCVIIRTLNSGKFL